MEERFCSVNQSPLSLQNKQILFLDTGYSLVPSVAQVLHQLGARLFCASLQDGTEQLFLEDIATIVPSAPDESIPQWMKRLVQKQGALDGVCVFPSAEQHGSSYSTLSLVLSAAQGLRQKKVRSLSSRLVVVSQQTTEEEDSLEQGALRSFLRSLAVEVAPLGMCINQILWDPSLLPVEASDTKRNSFTENKKEATKLSQVGSPLGEGSPVDLAHSMAFLLSESGRWVTGTTMVLDGGSSLIKGKQV